jgi:hypothetical protein
MRRVLLQFDQHLANLGSLHHGIIASLRCGSALPICIARETFASNSTCGDASALR